MEKTPEHLLQIRHQSLTPPVQRKWKRSDLPTWWLLAVVQSYEMDAWEHLTEVVQIPRKVVLAAIEREVRNRNLNYGVSQRRPWVRKV